MIKIIKSSIVLLGTLLTAQVMAVEVIDFKIGVDQLIGESQYEIGGFTCVDINQGEVQGCWTSHFPVSRLEFPLSQTMLNVGADFLFGDNTAYVKLKTDLVRQKGTFKDSDWTFDTAPSTRTIYSESTSTADATIVSVGFDRKIKKKIFTRDTYFGLDLTYQNFYFEARDTTQTSIDPDFNSGTFSGLSITYDVTYIIPKLFIRLAGSTQSLYSTSYKLSASPFVMVKDEDHHLARQSAISSTKVSKGDLKGGMLEFNFLLDYRMSQVSTLQFTYRLAYIWTKGTQTQTQDIDLGPPPHDDLNTTPDGIREHLVFNIDEEVTSLQQAIGVTLSTKF